MSKFKRLLTGVLSGAMAFSLVAAVNTAPAFAEGEGDDVSNGVENMPEVKKDGLAVKKEVTVNPDGTYDITLESYAEGDVQIIEETIPADIVLVLDVSGSMDDAFKTTSTQTYTYTPRNAGYNLLDIESGETRYYQYPANSGNYYPVSAHYERSGSNLIGVPRYKMWLTFEVAGTTYYLAGRNGPVPNEISITVENWLGFSMYLSTIWTGTLYTRNTSTSTVSITKLDALKDAVNAFIDEVEKKNRNVVEDRKSRVAIVKYAGDRKDTGSYSDYGVYPDPGSGANQPNWQYVENDDNRYRYNNSQVVRDLTIVDETSSSQLKSTVDAFKAAGATAADYGMNYAEAVFAKNPLPADSDRQQVVIMFTDGEPNHRNGFDATVANSAIQASLRMKNTGVIAYSIAIYQGADASDTTSNINRYLHGISSNYPKASAYNNLGARNTDGNIYYYVADNADQLTNIFKSISSAVGGSSSSLSSTAILRDIVSSSFALPAGFSVANPDNLTLQAIKWDTNTHDWSTENDTSIQLTATPKQVDGKDVLDVTGFDYSTYFRTPITPENENKDAEINKNARKLVVTIHGVQAKTSSITGSSMQTNDPDSGIYASADEEIPVIQFPSPSVTFLTKTFVIDYAKPFVVDYSPLLSTVDRIDDPSDDRLIGHTIKTGETGDFNFGVEYFTEKRNAKVEFTELEHGEHEENFSLTYKPVTMSWDGYDNIFIKGLSRNNNKLNAWAKISVIPANNIYYEDSFESNDETGTIGITYTGEMNGNDLVGWSTVGNTASPENTEDINGPVAGWINDLADDTGYSDGSAHKATASATNKAQASFNFKGTGVDIYSRTNNSTGTMRVKVTSLALNEKGKPAYNKAWIISNKSQSGDYYQIPTFSVADLAYGEYTVNVVVTTADSARCDYYLDGIRVYNPVIGKQSDETFTAAYEHELRAVFTKAKDLINTEQAICFVDEDADGNAAMVDYKDLETAKYAPLNEIYLPLNASVQLHAQSIENVYVGLKSPTGTPITVEVTEGPAEVDGVPAETKTRIDVNHSTDLYYKVKPNADGVIEIKVIDNGVNGMLSITKIRSTSDSWIASGSDGTFGTVDTEKGLKTANEFRNYRLVDYQGDVLDVTEEEVSAEENQKIEVIVENPEEGNQAKKETEKSENDLSWLKKLFGGFKGYYRP